MNAVPINMAEAIIDPLWDPDLSELKQWNIGQGEAHGLHVEQFWCWVSFEWKRKPAAGPALAMSRDFHVNCSDYDQVMVSMLAPPRSVITLEAVTDKGIHRYVSPPAPDTKKEHLVDVRGANELIRLTIEIDCADDGLFAGWLNWVGLRNTVLLEKHLARQARFHESWERYLKPERYEPKFIVEYGFLAGNDDIEQLRTMHDEYVKRNGTSPFVKAAEESAQIVPEQRIGDYINYRGATRYIRSYSFQDTRYNREREHGKLLLMEGPKAAIAGILLKDKRLLRLAARYAMAIAMCEHWDNGMVCRFPGSQFDMRCFLPSVCIHDIALILDLAGECFTDLGREFLLRRIAEEGLGKINFNTWKHEYMFTNNQVAWVTPGRMLGHVLLEKHWPRVRTYTDIVYHEIVENINNTVFPDGGYTEGPNYFACVGGSAMLALHYYSRARGRDFRGLIPDAMYRTADYAAAIESTDTGQDVVPVCDSGDTMKGDVLPVMASLLPDSRWVSMFHKSVRKTGMPETILGCLLSHRIPEAEPAAPAFTYLPDIQMISSLRYVGEHPVKIVILGNKSGSTHTHEDKGSFVLEFAGETFALDPGAFDYSSPLHYSGIKRCERHNMLVPVGSFERAHPQNPIMATIAPAGAGDETSLTVRMDVTAGWEGYYKQWIREWTSVAPDSLIIKDEYSLEQGEGVEFYWNTGLDVALESGKVVISGRKGVVVLEAPEDCAVRIDELPSLLNTGQTRIVFSKKGSEGSLSVRATLISKSERKPKEMEQ